MWKVSSNGKRVLVTKSMARQMAASGMSPQDEGYADQAAKLRDKNKRTENTREKAIEKNKITSFRKNRLKTTDGILKHIDKMQKEADDIKKETSEAKRKLRVTKLRLELKRNNALADAIIGDNMKTPRKGTPGQNNVSKFKRNKNIDSMSPDEMLNKLSELKSQMKGLRRKYEDDSKFDKEIERRRNLQNRQQKLENNLNSDPEKSNKKPTETRNAVPAGTNRAENFIRRETRLKRQKRNEHQDREIEKRRKLQDRRQKLEENYKKPDKKRKKKD